MANSHRRGRQRVQQSGTWRAHLLLTLCLASTAQVGRGLLQGGGHHAGRGTPPVVPAASPPSASLGRGGGGQGLMCWGVAAGAQPTGLHRPSSRRRWRGGASRLSAEAEAAADMGQDGGWGDGGMWYIVEEEDGPEVEVPELPVGEDQLNVVLTHTTADFDSLAAAVGLARLWQREQPEVPTYVCLPRGSHPTVAHFLALHKNLFPVITLRDIVPSNVHRVGLVDAQRRDRVGPAETLLEAAQEIHIYDHHFEKTSDIDATRLVIEKVGSVTTIITELLQAGGLRLRDAEATLMALGVHSDTGSLTYESATSRDARALAWLMDQGASQAAISEYGHASLSGEQQATLSEAYAKLTKRVHNGVTVGSALVDCDSYVKGMAVVAQNILEVSDSDVVLLAVRYPNKRGRAPNSLVLIGRANARAQGIDLNHLFEPYGGGGHPKASSASLRLDHDEDFERVPNANGRLTAEEVVQGIVDRICNEQIGGQERAGDIMTAPVLTCDPTDTIDAAARKLQRYGIRGMPVCKKGGDGKVVGVINKDIIRKAQALDQGSRPVSGWMVTHIVSANVNHTIAEVEDMLVMNDLGRVPVLEDGKLVGLITRTDLLRQHQYYSGLHYHNKAFADPIDSPQRKMLSELRKKLKKFDVD